MLAMRLSSSSMTGVKFGGAKVGMEGCVDSGAVSNSRSIRLCAAVRSLVVGSMSM